MNIVFGDRKQLSPNIAAQYITEPCGTRSFTGNQPLPCEKTGNVTDQLIDNIYCGAFALNVKRCAKPDQSQCEIGNSSKNETAVLSVTWNNNAPNIRCFYDNRKIDNINQLNNFKTLYGETESYKKVASTFCSQPSTNCLNGTQCSRLKSTDEEGNFCRIFYNSLSEQEQESLAQNICFSNPNIPDCSCYTRASNSDYSRLAISAPFKDSCWYVPCRDSFNNLIPKDLKNPTCPANVCQFILETAKNRNVNIAGIQSSIACQFEPTPPVTPPTPVSPATSSLLPISLIGAGCVAAILLSRNVSR